MLCGKLADLRDAIGYRAADGVKTAECHSWVHTALDFFDDALEFLYAFGRLRVEVDIARVIYLVDFIDVFDDCCLALGLADEAIYLERTLCNEAGGWQDQIAASFGGLNRINFRGNDYEVLPVIISPERKEMLNNRLLMFFTGFTRLSSEIQKTNRIAAGDKNAQLLEMYRLVDEAEAVLTGQTGDLDEFGRLLDVTWRLKRQTGAKVSTDSIDGIYEKGLAAGALGGKLLGAGGGGFLLFYVPEEKQPAVMEAMKDLLHVPFRFEDGGTRVIHYTPELYDLNEARN